MRDALDLVDPVIQARDVLESFLADQLLVTDWRATLTVAADRFVELGAARSDETMSALGRRVGVLADDRLGGDRRALTEAVAAELAELLDDVQIPGVPRPEDEEWGF
jgi:hypothetical protein